MAFNKPLNHIYCDNLTNTINIPNPIPNPIPNSFTTLHKTNTPQNNQPLYSYVTGRYLSILINL